MNELTNLAKAVCDVNEKEVQSLVGQMIQSGVPAMDIVAQCQAGMTELGWKFDKGECFIPELIMAGKIMEDVTKQLGPHLQTTCQPLKTAGNIVIGTVQYDIHNLGKDMVVSMLRGSGFDVTDLGVDVSPQKFIDAIREKKPLAIGMSVLVTTCYKSITETVEAIKQAGLRDQVSIMLGGAAASSMLAERTGCDYYGKTPVDAVNYATQIAQKSGKI